MAATWHGQPDRAGLGLSAPFAFRCLVDGKCPPIFLRLSRDPRFDRILPDIAAHSSLLCFRSCPAIKPIRLPKFSTPPEQPIGFPCHMPLPPAEGCLKRLCFRARFDQEMHMIRHGCGGFHAPSMPIWEIDQRFRRRLTNRRFTERANAVAAIEVSFTDQKILSWSAANSGVLASMRLSESRISRTRIRAAAGSESAQRIVTKWGRPATSQ